MEHGPKITKRISVISGSCYHNDSGFIWYKLVIGTAIVYLPMATVILAQMYKMSTIYLTLFLDSGKKWRRVVHLYTVYDLKTFVLLSITSEILS